MWRIYLQTNWFRLLLVNLVNGAIVTGNLTREYGIVTGNLTREYGIVTGNLTREYGIVTGALTRLDGFVGLIWFNSSCNLKKKHL